MFPYFLKISKSPSLSETIKKSFSMDKSDFSTIERELRYQDFMLHYLQEEQKKRWEEMDDLWRGLEKLKEMRGKLEQLQNDPEFKKLIKLAEKRKTM